jgi:threonine synthase
MKYYSTNNTKNFVSFREAIFRGLPEDNGLYMPGFIPRLPEGFYSNIEEYSLPELAYEVLYPYMQSEIDEGALKEILIEVFSFEIPLIELEERLYALELFHGPTCAFKDIGARFLARTLSYFTQQQDDDITILVATSGDTGSAVAKGFHLVPNVKVKILFPIGRTSRLQQLQMTTLGDNVEAYGIEGTFDDCQELVKTAFLDEDLRKQVNITSANSINIARMLPQSVNYFHAWAQLPRTYRQNLLFAVPSGNYGNLTAGLIAQRMGLPVKRFLAASNANNIVPRYLNEGAYMTRNSIQTISNSMDVGNPSNFARMLDLHPSHSDMIEHMSGYFYSDEEDKDAIKTAYDKFKYILDPHGALGFSALHEHGIKPNEAGIFLHTAHPAKFSDVIEEVIGTEAAYPEQLSSVFLKESHYEMMEKDYKNLREILLP